VELQLNENFIEFHKHFHNEILDLQLQAFAARDIAHGFLGHLSNTNCYYTIVRTKCVIHFKRL